MSLRVAREFVARQGKWDCFFATSYSFELELFDEYLFRRLGEPPLNATVLCDFDQLARRLDSIGPDDIRLIQRANRDFLLRGVHVGGAFHPKTYFFANNKRGVLLVGSGNLSLRGIEEGREVFCRFDSESPTDLETIRAWRDWVDALLGRVQDTEVSGRWLDLKRRTADWLLGAATESLFVSNLETSILDQFAERLTTSIDELHVLAPYYDRDAKALAQLVDRVQPTRLFVYLGAGTSVHGPALESVLETRGPGVEVRVLEPHEFVHAKLVGAVSGDSGWLLSGSANLSRAALTSAVASHDWANVEAGIIASTSAASVRASFVPPGLTYRVEDIGAVRDLRVESDGETEALPLRLLFARAGDDKRVTVRYEGMNIELALLTAGQTPEELEDGTTKQPLQRPEGGALVWLCNARGERLSNNVLLDDDAMLRHWLQERQRSSDGPSGLDAADLERPVGQFLAWLNEQCIFDLDDTRAAGRIRRLSGEETGEGDANWEFITALAQEELQLDPRIDRYRHAGRGLALDDDIFLLLELMLGKTPTERGLHIVPHPTDEPDPEPGPGQPWTMERRIRLRVFNILHRWCSALADPRFIWIDRSAPVRNYVALLVALGRCWEEQLLTRERVTILLEVLFTSFVRGERTAGYLVGLSDDDRAKALERLPEEARSLAAAMCFAALAGGSEQAEWIFRFQPFLESGLELDVFAANSSTVVLVERLVGLEVTAVAIADRLLHVATYLDDAHWCAKQERDLGLARVTLTLQNFSPRFGIAVAVSGIGLEDARLVSLVRQALAYRHSKGAIVDVGGSRLSVHLGDRIYAKVGDVELESAGTYDLQRLAELESRGIGFTHILGHSETRSA